MIDKALTALRPNAQWILRGEKFAGLKWLDTKQSKPTKKEIDAWIVDNKVKVKAMAEIKELDTLFIELSARILEDFAIKEGRVSPRMRKVINRKNALRKVL